MAYKSARPPWKHQKEALKKRRKGGLIMPAFAYLLGMRLGKTKILLDDFGELNEEEDVRDLLVLAPGGVYKTWDGALQDDFSKSLLSRTIVHVWESGSTKWIQKTRDKFMDLDPNSERVRVLLMNIEALSSVKEARLMVKRFLKTRRSLAAIDESTIIKEPSSERTKFVNTEIASLATYRRILSGLPTPNSPLDIYSQFEYLDWRILGHRNFYSFKSRYAISVKQHVKVPAKGGGFKLVAFDQITGYQDIEDINRLIGPYSFRATLDQVYDVPPPSWSFRDVSLTKEQETMYAELKKYATAKIEKEIEDAAVPDFDPSVDEFANLSPAEPHVTATLVITQIMKLHQLLLGHAVDEEGNLHELKENRTKELLAALEEYDGKAIIWCTYDYNIRKVAAALEKVYGEGSVAKFWGGNRKDREAEEARFKTDPKCRFMVATAAAGGRGRTWTVANLIIYYSSSYNLEHRSQSEERGSGVGKKESISYIDLRVRNSVEEPMINALRAKLNIASVITGDNYKEWLI